MTALFPIWWLGAFIIGVVLWEHNKERELPRMGRGWLVCWCAFHAIGAWPYILGMLLATITAITETKLEEQEHTP